MAKQGEFYILLRDFMDRKKITQKELAADTGLGPSLPKYVKGTRRITSMDTVDKIADSLQLGQEDREQLREAWRLETYGSHRIRQWRLLDDFFQHYHIDRSAAQSFSFRTNVEENVEKYVFLNGELDVQQAILAVLNDYGRPMPYGTGEGDRADEDPEDGKDAMDRDFLYLSMPPDDSLTELFLFAEHNMENLKLRHVFYLPERGESPAEQSRQNDVLYLKPLEYLEAVIPLVLESDAYEARYYYRPPFSESRWPFGGVNFLVSRNYAIIFGSADDGRIGLFSRDPLLILYLRQKFKNLYREMKPFLTTMKSFDSLVDSYYSPTLMKTEENWFSYSEQPCLCQYLTPDIVQKYVVNVEGPDGGFLREMLTKFLKNAAWFHANQREQFMEYSRLSGLQRFLETGRFDEIPAMLYRPLDPADRIAIISRWQADQLEHPTHFIREDEPAYNRLTVHCFPERGLDIYFFSEQFPCIFSTEEKSLVRDFMEYFSHVDEGRLLGAEEVKSAMDRMLARLKGQIR